MIALSLDELLAYTDEERGKWRAWLEAHPEALALRLQPDGASRPSARLIDHIFLVEARHLARLQRAAVPDASGLSPNDVAALFALRRRRAACAPALPAVSPGRRCQQRHASSRCSRAHSS